MDSNIYRDVLPIIFTGFTHDKNLYLVCKSWYKIYKETIAKHNIEVKFKKHTENIVKTGICSLNAEYSDIKDLSKFTGIKYLNIYGCYNLNEFCLLSDDLKNLVELDISYCKKITKLPYLEHLETLKMMGRRKISNIEILAKYKRLKHLDIHGCSQPVYLPDLLSLETLFAGHCHNIHDTILHNSGRLKKLSINYCIEITKIPDSLFNLKILNIEGCKDINNIDVLGNYKKLEVLDISRCSQITKLPIIPTIKMLNIAYCYGISELPLGLKNLEELRMRNCKGIKKIDILENSPRLKYVDIRGCKLINMPYFMLYKVDIDY